MMEGKIETVYFESIMALTLNYDEQINLLQDTIASYEVLLEQLKSEYCDLLVKKQSLDMDTVLECIVANHLSANEVMELVAFKVKSRSGIKKTGDSSKSSS